MGRCYLHTTVLLDIASVCTLLNFAPWGAYIFYKHLLFVFQVVYTQDTNLQIHVHAEVMDPDDGSRSTSNNFHFTFRCHEPTIPSVMPKTYAGMGPTKIFFLENQCTAFCVRF
jgi:hypothetical protein